VRDGDKVREDGLGLDGTVSCWTQSNGRCIRPEKVLIVADQSDCNAITTSYRKCICTTYTDQLNRWKSIISTARISKKKKTLSANYSARCSKQTQTSRDISGMTSCKPVSYLLYHYQGMQRVLICNYRSDEVPCSQKKLFSSKLISRNVKLQLYNTLIGPTVTDASETWVPKENMTNKLMIFERKVTRKIFGPKRTADGCWRIKTNQEINDILKGQNIIGFIKNED